MNHIQPGLVRSARCPHCSRIISLFTEPQTLLQTPEPLDYNDPLHWECAFCGFSKTPAEWETFFGQPTPLISQLPEQPQLFQ